MTGLPERVRGRAGLRVIGDVHGHAEPFRVLVEEARRLDLAVLQLGDVIDRGPDSPGAMALMLELLASGEGLLIPGNHCDKFYRHRLGRRVEIGQTGLALTLEQLAARPDGEALAERFARAVARQPLWRRAGSHFFVHAAFHPMMLRQAAPTVDRRGRHKILAGLALYGETDGFDQEGRPNRTYRWIGSVPAGLTVMVGHDVVSTTEIVVRTSPQGGRVLHLDLGIDRGGRLGFHDIDRAELAG